MHGGSKVNQIRGSSDNILSYDLYLVWMKSKQRKERENARKINEVETKVLENDETKTRRSRGKN